MSSDIRHCFPSASWKPSTTPLCQNSRKQTTEHLRCFGLEASRMQGRHVLLVISPYGTRLPTQTFPSRLKLELLQSQNLQHCSRRNLAKHLVNSTALTFSTPKTRHETLEMPRPSTWSELKSPPVRASTSSRLERFLRGRVGFRA